MKKIWSLLLTVVLLVPAFVSAQEPIKEDAAVAMPSAKTIRLIKDLGAYPELPDGDVHMTRGAFAAYAALLAGIRPDNYAAVTVFADVEPSYRYFEELSAAKMLGLVRGDEHGNFSPNDNITYESAVEIFVRLLGYYDCMDEFGGLMPTALQIGLLKGISVSEDGYVDINLYLALAANALKIDVMTRTGAGEYVIDGRTILEMYWELERYQGRVIACADVALSGRSNLKEDCFLFSVNGETMQMKSRYSPEELFSLLGRNAEVYCRKEDGELIAFSVLPSESDRVLVIPSDRLVQEKTTRRQVMYYEQSGSRPRTANVSKAAYVVYNRTAVSDYRDEDFRIADGCIKLIGSGSGEYDVALITSYAYTVVQTVSSENQRIFDQNMQRHLDLSAQDEVRITENGSPLELNQIKKSDLIVSETDKNGKLRAARRVLNRVVGEVEAISEDSCMVDGQEYAFSQYYKRLSAMETPPAAFRSLHLGDTVCLLLDENGCLTALVDIASTEMAYGYLIALSEEHTLSATVRARVLTADGNVVVFPLADKITLDGSSVKSDEILAHFADTLCLERAGSILEIGKVIKYASNKNGTISRIDTEYLNSGKEDGNASLRNSLPRQTMLWCSDAGSFSGAARVDDTTVFFQAPSKGMGSSDDYGIIRKSNLVSGLSYEISAYDVGRNGAAGAAVIYIDGKSSSAIDGWAQVYMFDTLVSALDDDGEPVQKVWAYSLNGLEKLTLREDIKMDGFQKGDLVRFGISFDGKVDNVETVLKQASITGPYKSHDTFTASYWFWLGKVVHTEGNVACVQMNADGTEQRYFDVSQAFNRCHYMYDVKTDKISQVNMEDILGAESCKDPSWILMFAWKGGVKDIFVYQNLGR